MHEEFTLRPLLPGDGPAMEKLEQQTPDTGAMGFYTEYHHDLYKTRMALQPGLVGVVAEVPKYQGLVGMALVTFGECTVEEEQRPYAYFTGLSVHPDFRRRGIATALANWRLEAARSRFGGEGVIFAGIQGGNVGSLRTAEKWSNQRLDGRTQVVVGRMQQKPPKPASDIVVRPAQVDELEEIADRQNRFYREFNLYPPKSTGQLAEWLARQPFGQTVNCYYVAMDPRGNLLAGMGVTREGALITSHLVRAPWILRVANLFLRLLPADGLSKRINGHWPWFLPGHEQAGSLLWESVRWLERENATLAMLFMDRQGPVSKVIPMPRFMPPNGGSLVLNTPVRLEEKRPLYFNNMFE
jgi:GNAT superfamily N-acetyltransferase